MSNTSYVSNYKRLRYVLLRLFAVPVPGLKAYIPLIGGFTAIEVAFLFIVIGGLVAIAWTGGDMNVNVASACLCYVLAMRNSLLTVISGVSYERLLFWHKCMGIVFFLSLLSHILLRFSADILSGQIILACSCAFIFSYSLYKLHFELFYYLHIAAALLLPIAAILHPGSDNKYIMILAGIWIADVFVRYVYM